MKDELVGIIKKGFSALKAKTYSYSKGNNDGDKKIKRHKKVRHKNKNLIQRL